jgi:hypothetical protein
MTGGFFFQRQWLELMRIPAKQGFSGAIEVRRSCAGEGSDAGALSEKSEEPFGLS